MGAFDRPAHPALLFLCVGVLNVPVSLQSDLELTCKETWIKGTTVTLQCTILRASYPSKCRSFGNITQFRRRDGFTFVKNCSVPNFSSCTRSALPPTGCACVQSSPNYVLEYNFPADESYNGTWDCTIGCFVGSTPALTLTTANCGTTVLDPCQTPACENGGVCTKNASEADGYTCNCTKDWIGKTCSMSVSRPAQSVASTVSGGVIDRMLLLVVTAVGAFVVKE